MSISVNPFPPLSDQSMGGHKLKDLAAPTQPGDAARWDDLQLALNYIIGVEWDTANSSPALQQIDAYGAPITQKTHAWFDSHPLWGNIRRCILSPDGVPTFGLNARGDGLILDGSAGQVMVYRPRGYVKAEQAGTKKRYWLSPVPFPGFEVHPWFLQRGGVERAQAYIGAYLGTLAVNPSTGTKYMLSASGKQPWTGGEMVEVDFNSGSVAPQIGEVITGATSLMKGIVQAFYVSSGTWAGGDAAGKIYLRMVSRRLTFNTGAHEPVVGETVTGASSGATGTVAKVVVSSGSWIGGDAAGYILLDSSSGNGLNYISSPSENIRDPESNVIGNATGDGSTLGQFAVGEALDGSIGGSDMATCQSLGSGLSLTRQLAETYCNNIGSTRWGCEDVWALDYTTLLYLIEYCNWNSQSPTVGIGGGVSSLPWTRRWGGKNTGADSSDTNIATNGTGTAIGTDGQVHVVYRGMEDPWGNAWRFIIGLDALDTTYRILKRDGTGVPSCPLTTGNYESSLATPITYNNPAMPDGYAMNVLFEDLTKLLFIPNLAGGSSSTYLCDFVWWHRAGQSNILLAGGSWPYGANCGVGCRGLSSVSSYSYRTLGARPEFV